MAKTDPLSPVYLIVGTDRPKVQRWVRRLRERVIEDAGSELNVDVHEVDAAAPARSLEEVLAAAAAPGLVLGTRLLLVLRVDRFRVPQRKALVDYLQDPMPETCLALEAEKMAESDALVKAVRKAGEVLRLDLPKKYEMAGWVTQRAKGLGLRMDTAVARHFLDRCGSDPSHIERLARELEKLATYCRGAAVTRGDVDSICSPGDETRIFELTDALGRRDRARGFALLEALYADGDTRDDANGIFYSLRRHVALLEQASELPHADAATAAKQLGVAPYTATKLLEQRRHFDRRWFGRAWRALAEAEAGLRGRAPATLESAGGVNDGERLVVELALARLLA